jgi:hypothetical protein
MHMRSVTIPELALIAGTGPRWARALASCLQTVSVPSSAGRRVGAVRRGRRDHNSAGRASLWAEGANASGLEDCIASHVISSPE